MSFDCSKAPELLGHAGATVVTCGGFYGSPSLWFVWLSTEEGALKQFVLPGSGEPFTGRGLEAAGRFLEEGDLDSNQKLDEEAAMLFLKVADAYPPGWTSGMRFIEDAPGIGGSGFRANPFTLTLIRAVGPVGAEVSEGRSGRGWAPPPEPLHQRAVLARSVDGVWEWKISNWFDGGWEALSTVELR